MSKPRNTRRRPAAQQGPAALVPEADRHRRLWAPATTEDELRGLVDALDEVRECQRALTMAGEAVASSVKRARVTGASWQRIGRATGLTAEGARRRWGR